MVWLVKDMSEDMPKEIRKVKYGRLRALYELSTAKIWIDNVRTYKGVDKKKNQFYIQTWHGSIGPKKIEKEIESYLSAQYIKSAKNDGKITDLMLSNNKIATYCYKNNFWYDGPVLEIGVPRNDIILNTPKNLKKDIFKKFNICIDKAVVLYAPTFRKNLNLDVYKFNYIKILELLKKRFEKDFVFFIRLHPNVSKFCDFIEYNESIINVTQYPDCQELLAISDVCISDYSSTAFDFAMINKPVFLLCKDFEDYKKNEREFCIDFTKVPFSIAITEEELIDNIKRFDNDYYIQKCKEFYSKYDLKNNPNSSKEIVKIIKREIDLENL